jgi:hypothetical protein
MRHLRKDYDRIQDPATIAPEMTNGTPFGADEPVFILRGRDMLAATCVSSWADWAEEEGAAPELVAAARKWADHMAAWGMEHGTKVPDAPPDLLRM